MNKEEKSQHVYEVFENISEKYDIANNRISLGLQKNWKKMLVEKIIKETPQNSNFLDVCCGTGDISIQVGKKRKDLSIIGVDFSPSMLEIAKKKSNEIENITWKKENALSLSFENEKFSSACISFGLRNTADYEKTISEMKRVIQKNGIIYCLDSFVPDKIWIQPFYKIYFKYIMPFLGGGKKHYKEYLWLYESTHNFLRKKELISLYKKLGLKDIKCKSKMFGACVLIQGKK